MQWPKVDVRLLPAIGLGLLLFSFLFVTSPSSTLARHGRRKGRRHHDVDDANESYAYGATVNVSGKSGIEFTDFILGFRQSTFLCTTLKCRPIVY